jgi:protein gp37
MAERTKIGWCRHTFNPWVGCSKVNEGCKNCYAEAHMDTRLHRVQWGPAGTRSRTKTWDEPPRWNRAAAEEGVRRKVFCGSLCDVFEDRPEFVPWRADLFKLIDRCPNLWWLLLTKRPENIRRMWPKDGSHRGDIWLGTSIATQGNANTYIDRLLACRDLSPVLFLSMEPQLERVYLDRWLGKAGIDWVITGGESGPNARLFNVDWARTTRDECAAASVPWFMKQVGANAIDGRRQFCTIDAKGEAMWEWPADLRIQQCPESFAPNLVACGCPPFSDSPLPGLT